MEENKDVIQESSPEQVVEVVSEDVKTPTVQAEPEKKAEDKMVPYDRFKKVNEELAKLKAQSAKEPKTSLDVEDYIDISASLEGLDQREKEKLAREHKLTGKPLSEIRKDEDFLLWQNAYRAKTEKERLTLKPSGTQSESEKPRSFTEKLAGASLADKEKLLSDAGLYKTPRPKTDRSQIRKF